MKKLLVRFAMFAIALCATGIAGAIGIVGLSLGMVAQANGPQETTLPSMGMVRTGQNVTVVNPEPVTVATYGVALGQVTLSYGEKCYMFKGAPFTTIGLDGNRALVRSRVQGPYYLYDEGAPVCAGDVLFWIGYQELLLSAQAYRYAEAEKLAKEGVVERDRRIIRQLLDRQLARK